MYGKIPNSFKHIKFSVETLNYLGKPNLEKSQIGHFSGVLF